MAIQHIQQSRKKYVTRVAAARLRLRDQVSNKREVRTAARVLAGGARPRIVAMDVTQEVSRLLDEILSLNGRSAGFSRQTLLLGAMPELDSMAVLALITGMSERFGISVDDDEIHADIFHTIGSVADFVSAKLAT
jgi:acyl carrier protein